MLTHPDNSSKSFTVRDRLLEIQPSVKQWGISDREGIVHRLDKQTSGLIVCALNEDIFKLLQTLFKERTIYKEYVCIVEGKLRTQSGNIEVPLSRSRHNRIKREVSSEGKISSSNFTGIAFIITPINDKTPPTISKARLSSIRFDDICVI